MSAGQGSSSIATPPPPLGTCPGCGEQAGGERCIHCGVAARVGPYRVRQVLGQRGAARTCLADDVDGLVVLKELSFATEPSAATLRAFHQETRELQGLTHPRIPRYLDMLQLGVGADTRLYLVQEFIEGTPLEKELASRPCTELEARELALQVLDILGYLHGRSPRVFHGDLKPANLIRRPDGALFLVDFGAAWVRGGASVEASRYTPPEQTGGELDATTDLYSLGVTLVDALSWGPEWRHPKVGETEALVSRMDVSPRFGEFLSRLTSADRALRFTSSAEALRALEAPEKAPRSRRGRVWPVVLGTGAALLLFGAGVLTGRATQARPFHPTTHCPPVPALQPCTDSRDTPSNPRPRAPSQPIHGTPAPPIGSEARFRTIPEESPNRVLEKWAPGHQPLSCEYAKGGVASASAHHETGVPQGAFDHDPGTRWRSAQSTGAWLQVDLGRTQVIDAAVVDWAWDASFGKEAQSRLMTSLDGSRWSYLHTVSNAPRHNNVPRRLWFPQRVARYVRFIGGEWNGGQAHVRSLELYGPDCPLEGKGQDVHRTEELHLPR